MQRHDFYILMWSLFAYSTFALACSKSSSPEQPVDAAAPVCDPSKCAPGNLCVQDRCRLPCQRHTDCPTNYDCRALDGTLVCVENGMPITPGAFGTSCGLHGDEDCAAPDFLCFGVIGDPSAYCTRQGCVSDADCPGNYFCSTIDVDADGGATSVCRKRSFCAPATALVDCDDHEAVYAQDDDGNGFCAKTCTGNDPNGCGVGNGCFPSESGGFICLPRSKSCKPTQTFCSRCWSNADCPAGGFCYEASMSHERFCTQPCRSASECPKLPGGGAAKCYDTKSRWEGQCLPPINTDTEAILSCWTPLPRSGRASSSAAQPN
jgi:hypothetical protein